MTVNKRLLIFDLDMLLCCLEWPKRTFIVVLEKRVEMKFKSKVEKFSVCTVR